MNQDKVIEQILHALEGLEYGSVNITIHDAQITQIDRIEKHHEENNKKMMRSPGTMRNKGWLRGLCTVACGTETYSLQTGLEFDTDES
ncbi:YezD family protein [Alicyclobacillus pomorum]|uniref:YezD family protein n=1 Tax=Alicyclobacillus pomorum TaxID=204470 RepID=UPI0009FC1745